ncbi:MAG: ABC transporter transmembrane domain-containing protein, partial [Duganella sp.]
MTNSSTANSSTAKSTNSTTGSPGAAGIPPAPAAAPSTARIAEKGSLATLRGLLPFLAPYKKQFAMAGLALLVAAGATLAIPAAFKQMIDLGFGAAGAGDKSIEHVDLVFLALFGLATVLALATAARFYTVSWLGERVTTDIRDAVYSHVVTQSPEFFETTQTGEVLSRITTDTTLIQAVVGTSISMALRNSLLFIG